MMSFVLEKRDLKSAALICLLAGVLVFGIYGLISRAEERQLQADAQDASQLWADYFSESLSDLEKIAAGARPSDQSVWIMKQAERIGGVFRYKIFNAQGYLRFDSDELELSRLEKPSLKTHNNKAAKAIETGKTYAEAKRGDGANRPEFYAETYLPILKDGRTIAVVEVYVDQSARYTSFRNNFLIAIFATLGLTALAFGAPAAAYYIRTRQKEEADRRAALEHRRLSVALSHMSQALCMFDKDLKLEIANDQYSLMYNVPPHLLEPGISFREIIEHRIANGVFAHENPEEYIRERLEWVARDTPGFMTQQLNDGRIIAITHEPTAGGGWVATHTDITSIRRTEDQVTFLENYDSVTNLPNRCLFSNKIEEAAKAAKDEKFAVFCLDLENYKSINDTLGHSLGDKLLRVVAERLKACIGERDTLSRLDNDKFAILLASSHRPEDARVLAKRLCEAVKQPINIDDHEMITDAGIGIAIYPMDGTSPDQLIRNADIALSRGHAEGHGQCCFFETAMDTRMKDQLQLERDLRTALGDNQFELYYQPLIKSESDEVCGFEALLRWNHPERGLVPPDEFIPITEGNGLIIPLGEWVIRDACATAASSWPEHVKVAVNLSTVQFRSENLVPAIVNALASSGLSPKRLELEITESIFLDNSESTLATLLMLRNLGVRIAMDDFGTGYSSLSYLRSFPFDKIKLDRCFIKDLCGNNDALSIIRAVASLGASLGMITTAEGVETQEQLEKVKAEGYTEIQGYYFSPPRPAKEMTDRYFPAKKDLSLFEVA